MLVLYKGRRGCGKTLTMVKDSLRFYIDGWKIFHNFSMTFGQYISNEEILNIDKSSDLRRCVLVIDEIQIFFDSRQSMTKKNQKFSNFIQQLRKRGIILLCTTQFINTVELRLRQHLDIIAIPKFIEKYNVCQVKYEDVTSLEDEDILEPNSYTIVYDTTPIYNLYDTDTLIS